MISKKTVLPVLIIVVASLAFAALVASKPTHPPAQAQARVWQVDVVIARNGQHRPLVKLFGSVESPHVSKLESAVSAQVTGLLVHEGDKVAAGTVLVQLDAADYQLALAERDAELLDVQAQIAAENQRHATNQASLEDDLALLSLYRAGVEREADLLNKNLGSQARADDARKLLRQQALQVKQRRLSIREHEPRLAQLQAQAQRVASLRERAALDVQRTRIAAPFSGTVTQTHVAPGDRVRQGDALISIYDRDSLEIRSQLPSRYVPAVRKALANGEPLQAELEMDGQRSMLPVDRLAGMIQKGSGGLDILFALNQNNQDLTLGQTVAMVLRLPAQSGIFALPATALYGNQRVYVVRDKQLHSVPVLVVGSNQGDGGESQVLLRSSEIVDGDQVITTQLPTAVDGLPVSVNTG